MEASLKAIEVFKCDILKKEYQEFVNETPPEVLKCNYCNEDSCKYHSRFLSTCQLCRKDRCKKCRIFNLQMDLLMASADDLGKNYIFNFVLDFLNISSETLKHFYNIDNSKNEKMQFLNSWKMHEVHGRQNCVSSVSSTIKYQYQMKNRKRNVYVKK